MKITAVIITDRLPAVCAATCRAGNAAAAEKRPCLVRWKHKESQLR